GLLRLGCGFPLRGGSFLLCRGLLLGRRGRSVGVLLLEAVDAPLRVDQLLLPGEERVAIAADIKVQVAVRRPRLPGGPARAVHLGGRVGRVDVLAHVLSRKGCESIADRSGKINPLTPPRRPGQAEVVYGSRFLRGRTGFPFWHTLANRLLTAASNLVTGFRLTDMETCYKVIRADVIKELPLREERFGFEPEVTALLAHHS